MRKDEPVNDRDEIIEVLARYARALEERDAEALTAVFAPDGEFQVFSRFGREEYVAHDVNVVGHAALRALFKGSLPPERGMHYLTTDHIVDITGDQATMHARFVVMESTANPRPVGGWPSGAKLMEGELALLMIGFYDSRLRKIGGRWVFARQQVKHSMPMTLPLRS
jgi:hypothetical protein